MPKELIKKLNLKEHEIEQFTMKLKRPVLPFQEDSVIYGTQLEGVDAPSLASHLKAYPSVSEFNFVKNDIFSGIDWIYTFVESMYAFNFRIFYYKYHNTFFDDSCDYFYNLF